MNNIRKKQKGFTLLEVLVTLLIMSLGLLGLAGFVINSVKYSKSAYTTSIASTLAGDIVDRMRANSRTALAAGVSPYTLAMGDATPNGTSVAATDLAQWRSSLAAALPSGTGSVCVISDAAGNPCVPCASIPCAQVTVITVQWDDSQTTSASSSATRQFRLDTML
jgi:type IV pilus assembly protein PilV